jgi:hypothetical protein
MPESITAIEKQEVVIEIGRIPIRIRTVDPGFSAMLEGRYSGFLGQPGCSDFDFDVHLESPGRIGADEGVRVSQKDGRWSLERGDFRAQWDPALKTGKIHQSANPYSIDAVLRIVHSLVLCQQGGFLLHGASAIRNEKAFLFAGVSGAGKTTIARLAPADAVLLTDEISYIKKIAGRYYAFGTPFAGELAQSGENVCAPVETLYLLAKGPENHMEPLGLAEACRELLSNILFFAEEERSVRMLFEAACEFVSQVPVFRLIFLPDAKVWETIA